MRKALLGLSVVLALSACSTRGTNQPLEVWSNFEQSTVSSKQLGKNQSLAVFYRQNDIQGPAVNVYVNGDYQASLLPNAFTAIPVCSAKNLFTSSFTTNKAFGNRTQGVNYVLPVGEIAYIKVIQGTDGKLSFVRVDKATAEKEVAALPKENQTLSRVDDIPLNCETGVLANVELDASALFAFNKSGYNDILPQGRKDLTEFAQRLPALTGATKVVVNGYTDPQGSEHYNQVLSQKRADTVKAALQKSGVTLPLEAVGYGESQPVVTHCESLSGKAQRECNQPNRRVEIIVYGNN